MTGRRRDSDAVVFDGGPWNGWWLSKERLENNRRASEQTGAPTALGYVETERWRDNPEDYGEGRVWSWQPSTTPGVICRLCDPRALSSTETYCERCTPSSPAIPVPRPAPRVETVGTDREATTG